MNWYILFSKLGNAPTVTKRMLQRFLPKGCSIYVPSYYKFNQYHKSQINKVSLFPFYIFIRCPSDADALTFEENVGGSFGYLLRNADNTLATLPLENILDIRQKEEEILEYIKPLKDIVTVGDMIEITYGPLSGLQKPVVGTTADYVYIQMSTDKGLVIDIPCKREDIRRIDDKH